MQAPVLAALEISALHWGGATFAVGACRDVAVAVAGAVAAAAKEEGVSSSAALACLPELGHSRSRNEKCLMKLQHELTAV